MLAGLNGAGKSRVLTSLKSDLGKDAILVQLHELCEHARASLRSRDDIEDLRAETGQQLLDSATLADLSRIVGRDYEYVEWYSLDFEPDTDYRESFRWPDGQVLVPHFRVKYAGVEYSSLDMGLGEFSVHLLFWLLGQYRDAPAEAYLLLDEPDAFLPAVTSRRLLAKLLAYIQITKWTLIIATHSEAIIEAACDNDSFVLLRRGAAGVEAQVSAVQAHAMAVDLLPSPSVRALMFCEDESAAALSRALLESDQSLLLPTTEVVWKDGDGYLTNLAKHLPRHPLMRISFSLVYDGDQRTRIAQDQADVTRWPSVCLPTHLSPDALFRQLSSDPEALGVATNNTVAVVHLALDALQGSDDHDWVSGLCSRLGVRTAVLDALAGLWVAKNSQLAATFLEDLQSGFSPRPPEIDPEVPASLEN